MYAWFCIPIHRIGPICGNFLSGYLKRSLSLYIYIYSAFCLQRTVEMEDSDKGIVRIQQRSLEMCQNNSISYTENWIHRDLNEMSKMLPGAQGRWPQSSLTVSTWCPRKLYTWHPLEHKMRVPNATPSTSRIWTPEYNVRQWKKGNVFISRTKGWVYPNETGKNPPISKNWYPKSVYCLGRAWSLL